MHEIKLLLSAKLCAVTVFASCRSKNVRQRFPPQLPRLHICDPAGVGGEKLPQCVWRSRIAVSATHHVQYRVLRLASAMTVWVGSMATIYRNVVCPLALKGVKNLKGIKLGQKQTCGNVCLLRSRIAVSATLPVPYRVH